MQENKSFLAKRMLKSSSVYAVSGILRNLVGFLMLPIYTRYLTPEDYGIVSLMIFFISLVEISLGARLGLATVKFFHDQEQESVRKEVVASALLLTSVVSLFLSIAISLLSSPVSDLVFGDTNLAIVVSIFSILITTQAIETTGLDLIRIRNKVWWYFWFSLAKLVVQLILNITFVVIMELGVLGVAIASAASSVIFATIMFLVTVKDVGLRFNAILAKSMFIFCAPLWISGIVSLYIGSSNRYWMRIYSSLDDIGFFALAERLASVLVMLLWQPFYQYWSVERFRIKDRPDIINIQGNTFILAALGLMIAALGLSLFADTIIWIIASENFRIASHAVPLIALAYVLNSLTSFFNFSFEVKSKTLVITKITNIVAVLITVLNILLIPVYGFVGAAAALAITSLMRFFISHHYSKDVLDLQLPLLRYSLGLILVVSGCAFILWFREKFDLIAYLGVTVLGFTVISTGAALIMLWGGRLDYVRDTLKSFIRKKYSSN